MSDSDFFVPCSDVAKATLGKLAELKAQLGEPRESALPSDPTVGRLFGGRLDWPCGSWAESSTGYPPGQAGREVMRLIWSIRGGPVQGEAYERSGWARPAAVEPFRNEGNLELKALGVAPWDIPKPRPHPLADPEQGVSASPEVLAKREAEPPRGPVWRASCHPCGDPFGSTVVPDSVCDNCGGEVELLEAHAADVARLNDRGRDTLLRLAAEVHKARSGGAPCQACSQPIRKGTRFYATPRSPKGKVSRTRRVHVFCARAHGWGLA